MNMMIHGDVNVIKGEIGDDSTCTNIPQTINSPCAGLMMLFSYVFVFTNENITLCVTKQMNF